ncbi:pentatricopeptide repeat-containing protein [Dorcoceras hygrometricum]|uniref:Pentatricopeptide repeat-containing protein n=1 Tax=Dorcoceras hygrometricum TaxID=472368 RepID=A0A2Z7BWC1_9LAMI|nr:pentatricopeptide repeat-containing protein [Dorcoceras hygrometricum]
MSLFDLQNVCIVIGSLATLDLPMVVDLIGIYVLKGPYCTLTTTNWFLQALSVIPRGSWGDVARRFTMIRWVNLGLHKTQHFTPYPPLLRRPLLSTNLTPPPSATHRRQQPHAPPPRDRTCFDHRDEEIPFVSNSSVLLVQVDEGFVLPVVDLIDDLPPPTV